MHIGRLGVPAHRIGESSQERRGMVKRTDHAGCHLALIFRQPRPENHFDRTIPSTHGMETLLTTLH